MHHFSCNYIQPAGTAVELSDKRQDIFSVFRSLVFKNLLCNVLYVCHADVIPILFEC